MVVRNPAIRSSTPQHQPSGLLKRTIIAVAGAYTLMLGGCSTSTVIRNTANSECERRVDTDRARCLRNNRSSDEALAARNDSRRESKDAWATQTLERLEAEAGK
jgi:hypothetical protein